MTGLIAQGEKQGTGYMNDQVVSFLKELMRRRHRLPSQLSTDLGLCHPTVARWLSGTDVPNTRSCRKLAEYSGVSIEKILSIFGHLLQVAQTEPADWPEFREYAQRKYPSELDEDIIILIEDFIERRRSRVRKNSITQEVHP